MRRLPRFTSEGMTKSALDDTSSMKRIECSDAIWQSDFLPMKCDIKGEGVNPALRFDNREMIHLMRFHPQS